MDQIDRLEEYEADYKTLVSKCRALLMQASGERLIMYRKVADLILGFRKKYETIGLMQTLNMDLGISNRTLSYILAFREEYAVYDKTIPWAYYIELLTHLPKEHRFEFQNRIASGKIRNRDDLRAQIKSYKKEKNIPMP